MTTTKKTKEQKIIKDLQSYGIAQEAKITELREKLATNEKTTEYLLRESKDLKSAEPKIKTFVDHLKSVTVSGIQEYKKYLKENNLSVGNSSTRRECIEYAIKTIVPSQYYQILSLDDTAIEIHRFIYGDNFVTKC